MSVSNWDSGSGFWFGNQVWDSVWDSCFVFRWGFQVYDSGKVLMFGIHVWDSGLGFV